MTVRTSRRARTRASNLKNAQNSTLNKGEYISDDFEHFENFRPYVSVRALCARATRTETQNSKILHFLDFLYPTQHFPLILSHFGLSMMPYARVKVQNPRVLLWAIQCKKYAFLKSVIAP